VNARADMNMLDDDGHSIQSYISQAPGATREMLMQWWKDVRAGKPVQLENLTNGVTNGTKRSSLKALGKKAAVTSLAKKVFSLSFKSSADLNKDEQQKGLLTDVEIVQRDVQDVEDTSPTVSPRRKSVKSRQRGGRSSKRQGTLRWECPRCGGLNVGIASPENKCRWCTETMEPTEKPVDTGPKEESSNSAKVVFTDNEGVELQFVVEPKHGPAGSSGRKSLSAGGSSGRRNSSGRRTSKATGKDSPKHSPRRHHAVVNCYRAGTLESVVKRLHLHWRNGVIEEFGHEFVDGQETAQKTKSCYMVPTEVKQDVFTRLGALCENKAKVVYVGQPVPATRDAG